MNVGVYLGCCTGDYCTGRVGQPTKPSDGRAWPPLAGKHQSWAHGTGSIAKTMRLSRAG